MVNTRHVGVASLGIQSLALTATQSFCQNAEFSTPAGIIQGVIAAFTAIITAKDWLTAHKSQ